MYPEIEFISTDTEKIARNLISDYEKEIGETLYPADPKRLFLLWIAKIIAQERIIINEAAKQNVPRYAKGEYLDSLGEIFSDTKRLKASPAKATFEFELSEIQALDITILRGTRITTDGSIIFETVEDAIVKAGDLTCKVVGICQNVGGIGNGYIRGQVKKLVDVFPFYKSVKNITDTSGGIEKETDKAYFERMKNAQQIHSTAGPVGAYIYHTKSTSSLIGDVAIKKSDPGIVDIRIITKNGDLPSAELLSQVKMSLMNSDVRPLTDNVIVSAPETATFDIDVVYFLQKGMSEERTKIAIDAAIAAYINWQTTKLGRDINPSHLIKILMETGIKRVEVNAPKFRKIEADGVATIRKINVVSKGIEDE